MTLLANLHTDIEQAFKAMLKIKGVTYTDWLRERVFAEFAGTDMEGIKKYFPDIERTLTQEKGRLNRLAQTDAIEEEFLFKVRDVFKRVEGA